MAAPEDKTMNGSYLKTWLTFAEDKGKIPVPNFPLFVGPLYLLSLSLLFRCGRGVSLLLDNYQALQEFISGTPLKSTSEKNIYQKGALRKVSYSPSPRAQPNYKASSPNNFQGNVFGSKLSTWRFALALVN